MNYRKKLYSSYISTHTSHLYGKASLDKIKKHFPAWRKYFGKFLPKDKNARIIDLGCGNGGFVWWLQNLGYENTEGIDVSLEQIETGKKLGIRNIHQADIRIFLNNLITNKSITQYDVIVMQDVLEHFKKEEILDLLDLIYKSLITGGILVVQTVNAENILWGRLRHGDFTHNLAFTKKSIAQVLNICGFNEIKVYPQRPVIHGLKSLARFVLWKLIEAKLKFYLLIETGSPKGIFTQNIIVIARK